MIERKENESLRDYLFRGVEYFMTLTEEPVHMWCVARPTEAAQKGTLLAIEMIAQAELPEPMMMVTLDQGIAFEWNILGRELYLEVNADGFGGYLTVNGSDKKEEDNLAIDDAFFDKTVYWLTRNPKVLAIRGIHKLMDLPFHRDNFSAARPTEAQKDLNIGLILALPWSNLPIPIVMAGSDGTMEIKWGASNRNLQIWIYPDLSMEYVAVSDRSIKTGDLSAFDARLASWISWFTCNEC